MSAEAIAAAPARANRRARLIFGIFLAALLSWFALDLSLADAIPREAGASSLSSSRVHSHLH